jgi:hypothetical protein
MLDQITPVILTYNEARNILRTLSRLRWAKDIVVLDSGSTDETQDIARSFPNVRLFTRSFDSHGRQWRYAIEETGIATPWVLRLDADYQVGSELVTELSRLSPSPDIHAYRISFDYAVFSRPLRTSLYPSNIILLRKSSISVADRGHTEIWAVKGKEQQLHGRVVHDDWKTIQQWLSAQGRYMSREMTRLLERPEGLRDWLRLRPPLMPLAAFFYCLFFKGLILNGRAGLFYTMQRTLAEALLSLLLLERRLKEKHFHTDPPDPQ